jgi:hypothetical protein
MQGQSVHLGSHSVACGYAAPQGSVHGMFFALLQGYAML